LHGEPLETRRIELTGFDGQEVTGSLALQLVAIRAESLAQTRNVHVEGMSSRLRLVARPEVLDEAVGGDQDPRTDQKAGQESTLARRTEIDQLTSPEDLHWSEDPIVRAH
jgi:hypothetical protein